MTYNYPYAAGKTLILSEIYLAKQDVYHTQLYASLFLFLLLALFYLYRQKQAAYRALVIKTRQWAETPFIPATDVSPSTFRRKSAGDEETGGYVLYLRQDYLKSSRRKTK